MTHRKHNTQCACETVCREIAPFHLLPLDKTARDLFSIKSFKCSWCFFFALSSHCVIYICAFWVYILLCFLNNLWSAVLRARCAIVLFGAHLYSSVAVAVAVVVHTPSRIHHHLPLHISDKIMKMMHFPSHLLALRFTSGPDFSRPLMINRSVRKHAKTKEKKMEQRKC